MLKRLRRPTALVLTTLLPASLALAACGGGDDEIKGFDAMSISGEVGEAPEIDWKGTLAAGKATSKVLVEGDGAEVSDGDELLIDLALVNGYTHQVSYSTFDADVLAATLTVGATEPETALDVLTAEVRKAVKPGQKLGTRVAVTVGSDVLLNDYLGNQAVAGMAVSMDIGNEDGLLFIADLRSFLEPSGTEQKPAAWAPAIVDKDGVPARLDFAGTPGESGKLRVTSLVKGDGPVVTKGQQVMVNYLGQTRAQKKPFDESYTKSPFTAVVGGPGATVVKGWSQALVGLPVGSRVLVEIPPSLGYGKKAQKDDKGKVTIPANSTLYFVVDILDAADVEAAEDAASDEPQPSESASE